MSLLSLASISKINPLIKNIQKVTPGIMPNMALLPMLKANSGNPIHTIALNKNTDRLYNNLHPKLIAEKFSYLIF